MNIYLESKWSGCFLQPFCLPHPLFVDGWLVGLGFTVLKHFIGYIAPVSVYIVNVRVSECAELMELYYTTPPVGSYHLAPSSNGWILLPLSHWGNVPSLMGSYHSTLPSSGLILSSPSPQGANTTLRHNT